MTGLVQDLRLGARRLLGRPGLLVPAVLTLALGIGANGAIFSLIRAVLLEPLPYAEPERLVMIWQPGGLTDQTWLSSREWVEYGRATDSFEQLAAYMEGSANLTEGVEPERVRSALVTGNAFATLGVPALHGRTFSPEEDAAGSGVVVIGYQLWQRRFGGAGDVVGRAIRVNGEPRTVVGIMPPGFQLPLDYREERPTELWLPAAIDPADAGDFGSRSWFIFARLRPGVTAAAATADVHRAAQEWERLGFIHNRDGRLTRDAIPLDDLLTRGVRPALLVLLGAVAFILLIACANVANLLLAQADARRREIATMAALGASRARIARQLLGETALLAGAGALLGIALAHLAIRFALAAAPVSLLRARAVPLDAGVLVAGAVLALVVTALAGLAPALQLARVDIMTVMSSARGAASEVRRRLRHGLVVAETALSVVLVICAVLLLRSLLELRRVDLGFEPRNLLTLRLALPPSPYDSPGRVTLFYRELVERVEAVPGVRSAAAVRLLPLTGTIGDWSITIEGRPRVEGENPNGDWQVVTPGYFETMGIRLRAGRFLADTDDESAPMVALLDATMATIYLPGQNPVGQRFHLGTADQPWITIVGVTEPVRHNAVVEEPRTEMFLPHAQFPREVGYAPAAMTLVVRTDEAPLALLPAVRARVGALDPALPISDPRTMESVAAAALAQPRFLALLLAAFAGLALALAAVGMYGVVAYLAARRTHEIGIRMALGARGAAVVRMVLGEAVALGAAGVAAGVLGAALLTRLLSTQLYAVRALDPITFVTVPALLLGVAVLAAWLPARRAAATQPGVALRTD